MFNKKKEVSITDLKGLISKSQIEKRHYKILMIDDQKPILLSQLRKLDFNISHQFDIDNIESVEQFPIILCDIDGVGKSFGSKYQGGHLIMEIRKKYPLKYIIAFSAKSFDVSYNKFYQLCDNVMEKNVDITDWSRTLDTTIRKINDPMYIWNKTRKILLDNEIPLDKIVSLELELTKSILNKNNSYLKNYINAENIFKNVNIRKILNSLLDYVKVFIKLYEI